MRKFVSTALATVLGLAVLRVGHVALQNFGRYVLVPLGRDVGDISPTPAGHVMMAAGMLLSVAAAFVLFVGRRRSTWLPNTLTLLGLASMSGHAYVGAPKPTLLVGLVSSGLMAAAVFGAAFVAELAIGAFGYDKTGARQTMFSVGLLSIALTQGAFGLFTFYQIRLITGPSLGELIQYGGFWVGMLVIIPVLAGVLVWRLSSELHVTEEVPMFTSAGICGLAGVFGFHILPSDAAGWALVALRYALAVAGPFTARWVWARRAHRVD